MVGRIRHGRDLRHLRGQPADLHRRIPPALQRSIHDRFVGRLIEAAKSARIGDPMLPDTYVGPITTEPQYRKVLDYITIAKQEGARCVLGGAPIAAP